MQVGRMINGIQIHTIDTMCVRWRMQLRWRSSQDKRAENMTVNQTNGYFSRRCFRSQETAREVAFEQWQNWKFALRLITELIIDDPDERDSGEYSNLISVIFPFWRVHLIRKYVERKLPLNKFARAIYFSSLFKWLINYAI